MKRQFYLLNLTADCLVGFRHTDELVLCIIALGVMADHLAVDADGHVAF